MSTSLEPIKSEQVQTPAKDRIYIIGIGASAGGLEALQDFLKHFPDNQSNFCIIVAQHLSPTYRSMLVQLLKRETKYEVKEAVHKDQITSGMIYITPPDKDIRVIENKIVLSKPHLITGPKPSVDTFFTSLSLNTPSLTIGVILSGTGSDGAEGIKAIKENGGITIVQEPQTAKYNGMPLASIETGAADLVLSPDKMGEEIREIIDNPESARQFTPVIVSENNQSIETIFRMLTDVTGTDFSNYKPSTFCRRLEKRLGKLKIDSIESYLQYIEKNPEEVQELFKNILIGVTSFFRDKEAFKQLEETLQKLIAGKNPRDAIRIWTPGCATGEEAYSIAILINKILKDRASQYNIQIFGTDLDENAINTARKAIYPEEALANLSPDLKESYFMQVGDNFEVIKSVRSMVLFSRHDVTNNPPFLKLDLISCRNLLIYFGNNLQKQIIPLFHYALNPHGFLFLGKSETVGQYSDLFATIDGKSKIFQRKIGSAIHAIKFSSFKPIKMGASRVVKQIHTNEMSLQELIKESLYMGFEDPYVVVNDVFDLMEVTGDIHDFLQLSQGSVSVNILKMIKPELQLELRTLLTKSQKEMQACKGSVKRIMINDKPNYVRIHVKPVISAELNRPLIIIFEKLDHEEFQEIVLPAEANSEVKSNYLKELENELAATKEHLQTYIEELETTNEELQSLNEELQSTNEELQSSNEELETTNEELQATNEEIQVAYTELKSANLELETKDTELRASQSNLKALLNNTLQSFVLLDTSYNILSFNETAALTFRKVFNTKLRSGVTILESFLNLQIDMFIANLRKALEGEIAEFEIEIPSEEEGKDNIIFHANLTPIYGNVQDINGISFSMLDISAEKKAKKELIDAKFFVDTVFNAAGFGICVTDQYGRFVDMNDQYCNIYGYSRRELRGKSFTIVVPAENRSMAQQMHDDFIAGGEEIPGEWTVVRKDGTPITINTFAARMLHENGDVFKVTSIVDISDMKKNFKKLEDIQHLAKVGGWEYDSKKKKILFDSRAMNVLGNRINKEVNFNEFLDLFKDQINRRMIEKSLKNCMHSKLSFDLELQLANFEGQSPWVRISGHMIDMPGLVPVIQGFIQNIDTSKTVYSDLKIFTRMFEQSPSPIIVTDPTGIIEYVNPAFCQLSGYSYEESIGSNARFLKWPESSDDIYAALWKTIRSGINWSGTLKNRRKDGEAFWVSASIAPLRDHNNKVVNYISIQENITDRIMLEQEIKLERVSNQKKITDSIIIAQEKERKEIGQELHDNINQMLASAKIYLSATSAKDPLVEKVEGILSEVIHEIRRMSHMLVLPADLNTNLSDMVNNIIQEYTAYQNIHIETHFENFNEYEIPQNMKLNIYRIFQIQLSNIFRHSGATQVYISLSQKDRRIYLEIKDNGKGFDPLQKRSGIGLTNLKTRTALFDGNVVIDSAPGQGCRILCEMNL